MRICYVDEAGCTGALPSLQSDIPPVFVVVGVELPASKMREITREFNRLKKRYFPGLVKDERQRLAWNLIEIKGASIRKASAAPSRNKRRHTFGFLDQAFDLLESFGARISGRVWVKGVGRPIDGRAVYTFSMQYICASFQYGLTVDGGSPGLVVCDSRDPLLNSATAHSVFTQKHRARGDVYPNLVEMPVFGHSTNHVGLQLADLVGSAVLYPIAVQCYCRGIVRSVHIRNYTELCARYAHRIEQMGLRRSQVGEDGRARWLGGISVDDKLRKLGREAMFGLSIGGS